DEAADDDRLPVAHLDHVGDLALGGDRRVADAEAVDVVDRLLDLHAHEVRGVDGRLDLQGEVDVDVLHAGVAEAAEPEAAEPEAAEPPEVAEVAEVAGV